MCIRFINRGGNTPNLQEKSITITSNTTTIIEPDTGYDGLSEVEVITNVSGGADISEYFKDTVSAGGSTYSGINKIIKKVPANLTISGTSASYLFNQCTSLIEIPLIDTSNITQMGNMCDGCTHLVTVPVLNTSKAKSMTNCFRNCTDLSNATLNNIMEMCINTTSSYTSTKTLSNIGLTQAQATTCQSLSNYQAFLAAGWTTGY